MSKSFANLVAFTLLTFVNGCSQSNGHTEPSQPAILIYQSPEYLIPSHGSIFPGGLVAAFWHDGRLIRAVSSSDIGKLYVEGRVTEEQREEVLRFLTNAAKRAPESDVVPLESSAQIIVIRIDGRKFQWSRNLPDSDSIWSEVQLRLLSLPIEGKRSIELADVESSI